MIVILFIITTVEHFTFLSISGYRTRRDESVLRSKNVDMDLGHGYIWPTQIYVHSQNGACTSLKQIFKIRQQVNRLNALKPKLGFQNHVPLLHTDICNEIIPMFTQIWFYLKLWRKCRGLQFLLFYHMMYNNKFAPRIYFFK